MSRSAILDRTSPIPAHFLGERAASRKASIRSAPRLPLHSLEMRCQDRAPRIPCEVSVLRTTDIALESGRARLVRIMYSCSSNQLARAGDTAENPASAA